MQFVISIKFMELVSSLSRKSIWETLFGCGLYWLVCSLMYFEGTSTRNLVLGVSVVSGIMFLYFYNIFYRRPKTINSTVKELHFSSGNVKIITFGYGVLGVFRWVPKYVTIPNEEFTATRSEYPIKDPKNIKEVGLVIYYQGKEFYVLPEFFEDELMDALKF